MGSVCYARIPRTGLGNALFVWARAFVFSRLNSLPLVVSRWERLRIGWLLRGEPSRIYAGLFKTVREIPLATWLTAQAKFSRIVEPEVALLRRQAENVLYAFDKVPHWRDPFRDIREQRDSIRAALLGMMSRRSQSELAKATMSNVSVHVRLGDFKQLEPGADFSQVGNTRTPFQYFIEVIQMIREQAGWTVPITIFSDGRDEDLRKLTEIPHVRRAKRHSALVDMLLMSRSKIVIPSAGSTLGLWSAFLSDGAVLLHPDHCSFGLRPAYVNEQHYEGPPTLDGRTSFSPLLLKAIQSLRTNP